MKKRLLTGMLVGMFGAAMVLAGCGSATTYQMATGDDVIAPEGEVTLTQDDNGNQFVELEVFHLPDPEKFDEQFSTFSVWVLPEEGEQYYNVGRLRLDDDQAGQLQFPTPFEEFNMRITAEPSGAEQEPSSAVVLHQMVGG